MDQNKQSKQAITRKVVGNVRTRSLMDESVFSAIEKATDRALSEATSGKEELVALNSGLNAVLKADKAAKLGRA